MRPRNSVWLSILLVFVGLAFVDAQQGERRLVAGSGAARKLALVVGIDNYHQAPLANARNDARAIAAALRDLGFVVTHVENSTRPQLASSIARFGAALGPDDIAWFFYAGHGVQISGENFLIPSDFGGSSQTEVRLSAISLTELQNAVRKARVSIVVLDACRNNPYAGDRAGGTGLAPVEARGNLVAFATGAGQVASDNASSGNGLFTQELLKFMRAGIPIRDVFFNVRQAVYDASRGRQFPAVYDGLLGNITLSAPLSPLPPRTPPTATAKPAAPKLPSKPIVPPKPTPFNTPLPGTATVPADLTRRFMPVAGEPPSMVWLRRAEAAADAMNQSPLDAYLAVARALAKAGDFQSSARLLEKAKARYSGAGAVTQKIDALVKLASAEIALGLVEDGKITAAMIPVAVAGDSGARKFLNYEAGLADVARAFADAGHYSEALKIADEVRPLVPFIPIVRRDVAESMAARGDVQLAIDVAARTPPEGRSVVLYEIGRAASGRGDVSRFDEIFRGITEPYYSSRFRAIQGRIEAVRRPGTNEGQLLTEARELALRVPDAISKVEALTFVAVEANAAKQRDLALATLAMVPPIVERASEKFARVRMFHLLAKAYFEVGLRNQALFTLQSAQDVASTGGVDEKNSLLDDVVDVRIANGDLAAALRVATWASEEGGFRTAWHRDIGIAHASRGELADATAMLTPSGESPELQRAIARYLGSRGSVAEATKRASEIKLANAYAWFALGVAEGLLDRK